MPDLSNLSVFLDFDGTISRADVGLHLMERLAPESWRAIEDEWLAGGIGSRECLTREWALLPHDESLVRAVAAEVAIDDGFGPLVAGLRAAGAEVTVVSDGFGFYTEAPCAAVGVEVVTNAVDFGSFTVEFPNEDRCCPCSTCGTCKQAPLKDARRRGRTTVLVGDGASDRKAALLADVVFAKDRLADWCDDAGVDYRPFATLADVRRSLFGRKP